MAAQGDLVLGHGERLAGGDEHLLADEVEPRHRLGDRVLDLDPSVHLHEEVLAGGGQEPFDRPGGAIPRGPCRVDGDRSDARSERPVDRRRGSLLDELLVTALDRAVALSEMDDIAVRVRKHLDLDMPRVLEVPLHVHGGVGEVLLALARRCVERSRRVIGPPHDLHALATAARGGLDDQRVAELLAERGDLVSRADRIDRTWDDRDAGGTHRCPRGGLRAHQLDRGRRWPDPDEARPFDEPRERGVLGKEPVPRVDRLCARPRRNLDHGVAPQVALRRRARPEPVRLVRSPDVRGPPVGVRKDGDASDPELAQRAEDADRDLAAVRDEHLRERSHVRRILPEP